MKLLKINKAPFYIHIFFYIFFSFIKLKLIFYFYDLQTLLNEPKKEDKAINSKKINADNLPKISHFISKFLGIKSCLINSIVLHKALKKINEKSSLHIGIVYKLEKFSSHAWVEFKGKEYEEGRSKNYIKLLEIIWMALA